MEANKTSEKPSIHLNQKTTKPAEKSNDSKKEPKIKENIDLFVSDDNLPNDKETQHAIEVQQAAADEAMSGHLMHPDVNS